MKKLLSLFLTGAALLSLSGCTETPPAADSAMPDAVTQPEMLTEPPELTVVCGEASVKALKGGYSWEIVNNDGTCTATIADSAHPLQYEDITPVLTLVPGTMSHADPLTAYLQFETAPDEVSVRCWSEDCWGKDDSGSEAVEVKTIEIDFADGSHATGFKIVLKDGGYIYEVTAEWDCPGQYSGKGTYIFCTAKPDMEIHYIKES